MACGVSIPGTVFRCAPVRRLKTSSVPPSSPARKRRFPLTSAAKWSKSPSYLTRSVRPRKRSVSAAAASEGSSACAASISAAPSAVISFCMCKSLEVVNLERIDLLGLIEQGAVVRNPLLQRIAQHGGLLQVGEFDFAGVRVRRRVLESVDNQADVLALDI